jgi:hypothetical protein
VLQHDQDLSPSWKTWSDAVLIVSGYREARGGEGRASAQDHRGGRSSYLQRWRPYRILFRNPSVRIGASWAFHLQGGNLVLRWSFAMRVLSEFAVIAKTWNLNFWSRGQMSIWAEGKT